MSKIKLCKQAEKLYITDVQKIYFARSQNKNNISDSFCRSWLI